MSLMNPAAAEGLSPIRREHDAVLILDQRRLPFEEVWLTCHSAEDVRRAIAEMAIRGAPAIGVAAAYGLALGARQLPPVSFAAMFQALAHDMTQARPTAVNLAWATDRMRRTAANALANPHLDHAARLALLDAEAQAIRDEDLAMNHAIGRHGAALVPRFAARKTRILTHCNTGSLATAGWGTALGVIRSANAEAPVAVFADETRPYLQGARLTAWELVRDGIDVTLIADGAAGHLIARGEIDLVVVGADRIAANGDIANKIGTFTLAVLCARHAVPFYVAAPTSTIDLATPDGAAIPIEERPAREVLELFGQPIAPGGVKVRNPSFDVTPGGLIAGIITERGVARPPYRESLRAMLVDTAPGLV